MKYDFYLESLGEEDIISFNNQMTKFGQVKQALTWALDRKIGDPLVESLESQGVQGIRIYESVSWARGRRMQDANWKWFTEGKDCEILRIGAKGWQKGKIKIKVSVEFEPDEPEISEPESPLDDLRQLLKQDN